MPFNDFPDEPAPQVLGFGYTLQLGYSAPARYSERLSTGLPINSSEIRWVVKSLVIRFRSQQEWLSLMPS